MKKQLLGHPRINGALFGIMMVPVLLFISGCEATSTSGAHQGTEYVVFIDFSSSVQGEDRGLFQQELTVRVIPTLVPGDRILIAPITDKTFTKFRPLIDETLPAMPDFNGWSDNRLQHQSQVKEVETQIPEIKNRLKEEVVAIFSKKRSSRQTDIFSSLTLAQKLFHDVSRRKVLILMSDMIEDYPPYRFDRVSWTSEKTQSLLDELRASGSIPDLSGVCIYVSGASASSPDLAKNIGSFWDAYFEQANADTHPSRYAHVLLHWPPSKSCLWGQST